jgi:hypothetical protein
MAILGDEATMSPEERPAAPDAPPAFVDPATVPTSSINLMMPDDIVKRLKTHAIASATRPADVVAGPIAEHVPAYVLTPARPDTSREVHGAA